MYQFPKSNVVSFEFRIRDTLKESICCFLIRLSPLVLVPIDLFHRTQSPNFIIGLKVLTLSFTWLKVLTLSFIGLKVLTLSFIGLKVLVFIFHRTQSPLSLCFHRTQSPLSFMLSKTIKVYCLEETSMSSAFTFQRLPKSFLLQRLQCLMPLLFKDC